MSLFSPVPGLPEPHPLGRGGTTRHRAAGRLNLEIWHASVPTMQDCWWTAQRQRAQTAVVEPEVFEAREVAELAGHVAAAGYDPDGHALDCDECFTGVIVIDPPEPACERGETHQWLHCGVYAANGSGTFTIDGCQRCGLERKTGTWGTRSDTGAQNIEATGYR